MYFLFLFMFCPQIILPELHFYVFISSTVLCVSKNDTDVEHYNFDADQPILIIFGRDIGWNSMLSNGDLLYCTYCTFGIVGCCTPCTPPGGKKFIPEKNFDPT